MIKLDNDASIAVVDGNVARDTPEAAKRDYLTMVIKTGDQEVGVNSETRVVMKASQARALAKELAGAAKEAKG